MGGHSLFKCPCLNETQLFFFAYRYFRHHVEAKPGIARWYLEKVAHLNGNGPDTGNNPTPSNHSPSRSQRSGSPPNDILRRTLNSVKTVDQDSETEDSETEDPKA